MTALSFSENEFAHFRLYVETLTKYDDPKKSSLALQALSDTESHVHRITFVEPKNIDVYYETIKADNLDGYYTNCGLNEFKKIGGEIKRRKNYLKRIRGQIVDIDSYTEWDTLQNLILELQPTMAVATSKQRGKFKAHLYFLYEDLIIDRFLYKQNHLALAYLVEAQLGIGTVDKANYSVSQAFRVPGTYHQKRPEDVFLTQVIFCNPDGYFDTHNLLGIGDKDREAAVSRYERDKKGQAALTAPLQVFGITKHGADDPLVTRYPIVPESQRNVTLHEFVFKRLFTEKNLTHHEALGAALFENMSANVPPLDEQEVVSIVDSAFRSWQESFTPNTLEKMRRCDSKTARELLFSTVADTVALTKTLKKSPDWNRNNDNTAGYDYSDRTRFTSLISDTAILGRVGQKYIEEILCNPGLGILTYNSELGIWGPGEHTIPEKCMRIISELINDPVIYEYFRDAKGAFSEEKLNLYLKDCYSVRKLQLLTKGVHFLKELQVSESALDVNLHVINCQNGVIDLKTGMLLPHNPDFRMTKVLNAEYLQLPPLCENSLDWKLGGLWMRVLYDIMEGDIEMCLFLQRLLGYTLLGGNDRQILAFFFGQGSNGKSLILETLEALFGSYHAALKAEFLMADRNMSSPAKFDAFAQIRGCRLVTSSELDEGQRWAEDTLKDITGNDVIHAKFMGKGMFKFRPQATFLVRGNSRPLVTGVNKGIWRRFLTVGFYADFDENGKRDDTLFHQLREQFQLNDILGWLVRGCLEYQRVGLAEPEKVCDLKREYFDSMNPLQAYMHDCFEQTDDPRVGITSDQMIQLYSVWAKENDRPFIAKEDFGPKLKKYGITKSLIYTHNGKTTRVYPLFIKKEWRDVADQIAKNRNRVINIADVFKNRDREQA